MEVKKNLLYYSRWINLKARQRMRTTCITSFGKINQHNTREDIRVRIKAKHRPRTHKRYLSRIEIKICHITYLTRSIEADHQDSHLRLRHEAAEQLAENAAHD